MVLPVQSIEPDVLEVPEENISSDTPVTEESPKIPEGLPAPSTPQPKPDDDTTKQDASNSTTDAAPEPGKIVDKASKHKEKVTTLATPDETTLKADKEENEFIPLVEEAHDTANEQHS